MHPRAMAVRGETAQQRALAAAGQLAARCGVDASGLAVERRDPQVQGMERQEALADVLEGVLAALAAQDAPKPEGKGKK